MQQALLKQETKSQIHTWVQVVIGKDESHYHDEVKKVVQDKLIKEHTKHASELNLKVKGLSTPALVAFDSLLLSYKIP